MKQLKKKISLLRKLPWNDLVLSSCLKKQKKNVEFSTNVLAKKLNENENVEGEGKEKRRLDPVVKRG
jgi:hypothetical protein